MSAALAMSGCISFPELPNRVAINIQEIIDNIECEIQDSLYAASGEHYWLMGWAATITLNLETYHTNDGSGELVLSFPVASQTLGLTLVSGPTIEYNSVGTFAYSFYLIDIAERPCGPGEFGKTQSHLTGRTAAGDWLTRIARDASVRNICPDKIDYGLEFAIGLNGEGNPTITSVVGSGTIEGDFDLVGQKTKDHELTLSAVPVGRVPSPADAKQVNSVLTRAASKAREITGETVSTADILACAPLGIPADQRRQVVDNQTMKALDAAVAGSLVRSIGGNPVSP
ncbi:hypothetical protein OQ273_14680 [Hoeflea prorocentri]|uniref:Uncharacterized protein n=1 Tax=Hoeflea prorocentri TaxID=1922333 RepID=A0A9X3UMP6_9HYPH|nr:hypothetical protein [Hoeflea prorocentri]MDA5399824.1 hypothetical protein [Hoeflea prorocentri]